MWEEGWVDRCFVWKFSKMCSLGVSAAHIEEGKFSGASRGMMRAVYKIGKKHKAWQPTQPLRREVERERQGRPGPEHPLPCSIQLHSLPLAQDSHVGAPELGGGASSVKGPSVTECRVARDRMGQETRRVGVQVGAAVETRKPLPAGSRLHSYGNYAVGKHTSSLGRETKRRGIHQKKRSQTTKI